MENSPEQQKKNNNSNFGTKKGSVKSFYKPQTKFQIGQQLSREQDLLLDLFGGGQKVMFMNPDSQCLPKRVGMLDCNKVNGYSINEESSADLFGIGFSPKRTREFFGLGMW